MKQTFCVILVLLFTVRLFGQSGELAVNFRNPPPEYSLLPFWSWNGTLKPEKLKWQIDQMMEKGIYGAFLHARAGLDESETPYFSDGFWSAVDTTIHYSASKGFLACLYDEDKWPSGSAGGRTVASNPEEFVKKALSYTYMEVAGPQTIFLNLQKNPLAIFAGLVKENGNYDYSSQIDLTPKKGSAWNVPVGRWMITSFEMVKDPQKQIDYLDSAAVARFIGITHEEYFRRYGNFFGTTIPGIFFDEIFANFSKMDFNIFWTDDFLQKFRKIKGYDITGKLPLIFQNDPAHSVKVRYDYFDMVKELYVNAWFKQYAGWCAAHNIWATGHTAEKTTHYRRQADYFTTMGQLQVPGADNEEYRYGFPRLIDWYNTRQISSIARLYNRDRVMAEAMGGGGYTIPLEEYRYGIAMLGVYGINMFIPHLFHYTTDSPESQADWPPSWFYENPYWKYFKPLADYGSRIAYMIAGGNEVCDVAVLYPLTDLWAGGYPDKYDDSFYKEVQQELLDNQINYNIIDPESLAGARIENGKIAAGKGKFTLLILPAIQIIRTDVLLKIAEFIKTGGVVIGLKNLPGFSESGPEGDEVVRSQINDLFGIQPSSLRQSEYFKWNPEHTDQVISKTSQSGGAAIFTRFPGKLPEIIQSRMVPDIDVISKNREFLRVHHRRMDDKEVFLLVNDRNSIESYHISLKNNGNPSIWDPETGDTHPFGNFLLKNGRMELILEFKPRESYFLVLEPGKPESSGCLVEETDLINYNVTRGEHFIQLNGWGKADQPHSVTIGLNDKQTGEKWESRRDLPEISVTGDWQFQLAPHALDYTWSSIVETDTLTIPVMKFQAERTAGEGLKSSWQSGNFNEAAWRTVKITDLFNRQPGVQRYLSGWDAWWISYYDYSTHMAEIEGGERFFKKEILLEAAIKEAKIAITADRSYTLSINGKPVGTDQDWKEAELYDISGFLVPGENRLEVFTTATRGLLLQGVIRLSNGKNIVIRSDKSWMVSAGKTEWQPAFQFASPPLGSWGNIACPLTKLQFPVTLWYRQKLPPGVFALKKPVVNGKYSLYVNGIPVRMDQGAKMMDITTFLKREDNSIALRVAATDKVCGLLQPLEMVCGKSNLPLVSWNDLGLGWYSGRALYTKNIVIPANYLQDNIRLILNPGHIDHFAEIWVNGKLVDFCPWAPFETDITGYVKSGENTITIVVANLLANKATWNILDDNIASKEARWWHDGSILREKEKLNAGLFGPVRIVPYSKESVNLQF